MRILLKASFCFLIFFLIFSNEVLAQTDIGSWTSIQLKHKVNKKTTFTIKPILRHHQDLSTFQDLFLDLTFAYKVTDKITLAVLNRGIDNFDESYRSWFFFDLSHKQPLLHRISMTNRLRFHWGRDIQQYDEDFLRYEPKFQFSVLNNVTLLAAVDIQYQIVENPGLFRFRYQAGGVIKLSPAYSLSLQYWLDDFNENYAPTDSHLLVTNLMYSF